MTASGFSLQAGVKEQHPQTVLFFQKTDLQLSSKNVLQFYSFQKPEIRVFKLVFTHRKREKKQSQRGNKHVKELTLGTAVLTFN